MEALAKKRNTLVEKEKIPDKIFNIDLSESNKQLLSDGVCSALLKGVHFPDGSVKDCKVRLTYGSDMKLKFAFDFKNEKLVIPDSLSGYSLSENQKKKLLEKVTIGPLQIEGKTSKVYMRIDSDLNKVVVLTPCQIGIPNEVGDYVLSDKEKNTLANGLLLSQKVYKSAQGYFLARLLMAGKDNHLEFSEVKMISSKEAIELMPHLNHPREEVDPEKKIIKAKEKSITLPPEDAFTNIKDALTGEDLKAHGFIESMDLKQLNKMVTGGYNPPQSVITCIETSKTLTPSQRIAILTVLGIGQEKQKQNLRKEPLKRVGERAESVSPVNESARGPKMRKAKRKKAKLPSEKKRYAVKNLLDSAFSDV